ncbi:MAG: polysaccharide deacetylase family protein [Actinobacteria bacterium]|nr:polysaccharide deacetylase family protein [Actinomycetota bacterium]
MNSRESRRRKGGNRYLAAGGLAVLVVVGVVAALTAIGGTTISPPRPVRSTARRRAGHHAKGESTSGSTSDSKLVRNATPQPSWKPHTGPVPILVYHALGEAPPTEEYPGLYVPEPEFEAQMAWLHSHGFEAVTLDQVEQAWYHGGTLPTKPIVITFDNGYPAQVTFAPKVLSRYGWPGVLFEITEEHLYSSQIRPVIELGWEVDSHSATHPNLTELAGEELEFQVAGSRHYLQHTFGIPSDNFCYPSSEYDATTIAAVKEAGYVGAVTENPGYASRGLPYELDRFEIEGGQGVETLAADLASG